jgi:hypothetical protein
MFRSALVAAFAAITLWDFSAYAASKVERLEISSDALALNKIGLSARRHISVYLPDGYETSGLRYPVIYLLPNLFDTDQSFFTTYGAATVFDAAIVSRVIDPVIFVAGDFSTPLGSGLYVNSPVTGNWEDLLVREIVPYVDQHYRTLARAESRGLLGDRMGGHGALRYALKYPDFFSVIYAMAPVGTAGYGVQIMQSRPNWEVLESARTLDDVKKDPFSQIFTAIYQAHLPNPDKPPLYVDLPAHKVAGHLTIDAQLTAKLEDSFFIERQLSRYANNLKRLRALKLDWGRNDAIYDHVVGNQNLVRAFDELGIPYEAEEYHGGWDDGRWGKDGRVMTDILPFFARHMLSEDR